MTEADLFHEMPPVVGGGGKPGKYKRKLSFEDIITYARIIHALSATERLMGEIDRAIEKRSGWPLK